MLQRALPLTVLQYRRDRLLGQRVRELLRTRAAEAATPRRWRALLNMSTRTLHRQLQEEGSSLQALKDEVRHEQAIDQLGAPRGRSSRSRWPWAFATRRALRAPSGTGPA